MHAEAKLKRVRVELSRNMEIAKPLSKILGDTLCSRSARKASATSNTARISASVFSQVRKKLPSYILEKSSVFKVFSAFCKSAIG